MLRKHCSLQQHASACTTQRAPSTRPWNLLDLMLTQDCSIREPLEVRGYKCIVGTWFKMYLKTLPTVPSPSIVLCSNASLVIFPKVQLLTRRQTHPALPNRLIVSVLVEEFKSYYTLTQDT